ncbi:two-component system chemotaxis response regulator CheB [Oikeobacillus pervagus]|uniref:Protein-glutamate methylesterase/protein-glutamine glutaminase n=1 Tax=Oikeobacillus pervagus TaxID=1325931 RepID=A0AAJ1SZT1_9BACI|nr:chemotaxis response regulator protein-glutamate methylesterase [Oikeobacillus pervagus]MDQ0214282.1 two-component system chemotaxis response regulator CheB [Oikeobacillus pervagus]
MAKKKVLVVDDSAFMRKLISDFLSSHPKLEVIGIARNGKDALRKIKQLKPDVLTMDVEMPEMNGLEALKLIMENNPLPVVMLSSTTKEGTENTIEAMENGAIDFIAKPSGNISLDLHKVKDELIQKVLSASHVQVSKLKQPSSYENDLVIDGKLTMNEKHSSAYRSDRWRTTSKKIIVIGTSTGGPRALQEVLTRLPADIHAPILIVQHMPPKFTKSLATRLNRLCKIKVKEAEDGEILQLGTAYIAPGDYHLKVKEIGGTVAVHLDKTPPRNGHRPAVDVLFESVSPLHFDKIAVVMTGMGSDGANGLVKLKREGNVRAIAESKDTSVVFGMPKSAIATHLIDDVRPVNQIAKAILKYLP